MDVLQEPPVAVATPAPIAPRRRLSYQEATKRFQRQLLEDTLAETNWNVAEAARRLKLARSTIYELLAGFGLSRKPRGQ